VQVNPDRIEELIAIERTAKAAVRALAAGDLPERGAVVTFPVAVVAPGRRAGSNAHFWSYRVSHEPGSVFPPGATTVHYRGTINSVGVSGHFQVVVGEHDPSAVAAAAFEVDRHTAPAWAASLPGNQWAPDVAHHELIGALTRAARREGDATEQLMATAYPFLDQIADSFGPQICHRRAYLDREDVINQGWKRVYQLIDAFSGPDRPSAPWSTAVYRNCRRDMSRAVHALDGMSEAVATVRAACGAHPHITDPVVMARLLAVQAEERRLALRLPGLPPDQRRRRAESCHPRCPYSLQQIEWAMGAPRIVSWNETASRIDIESGESRERHHLLDGHAGTDDGGLAAVEAPAAAAARSLAEATGADLVAMLDVMTDLGVGTGGEPGAARLTQLRRRVLSPFILPEEKPGSEDVLRRAGHRARTKLFAGGELLGGARLAQAWREGISAEEARALDGRCDA
jgi:hypothetical protein